MRTAIATKFVAWEVPTLDALKGSKVYILREKLNNGGQMNREEKDWLTEKVNSNTYYYCFGCGANGDAIDLTANDISQAYLADTFIFSRNALLFLLKKYGIVSVRCFDRCSLNNLKCFYHFFVTINFNEIV